jgi:hypothetical protein
VALELGGAAMATSRPSDLELERACTQGGARRGGGGSTCDYGGNGSELREHDGHEDFAAASMVAPFLRAKHDGEPRIGQRE